MNILVLTTSYPAHAGDARGVFIHSVAQALARRGHGLRVVVPARAAQSGRHTVDGIEVHHFRYALTRAGHTLTTVGGGIPEALRRSRLHTLGVPVMMTCFAAAALRQGAWADVIWANWLGAGLAGAVVGGLCRKPMVLTLRGDDAYLVHDQPAWRFCGKWVFRRCAAVTAVSSNMVPLLDGLLPGGMSVTVPTFGVDVGAFHPADRPRTDPPQGLFVGNISQAKGVDVLLKALARCAVPCRFAIAGAGPDLDAMKQLADKLKLSERVQWLGHLDVQRIPELMRQSDFLVLPSRSEGRPNVVSEAMASGLAVIATPVGSVGELVRDGQTGLLVPVDNAQALADAMARLCQDPALRTRLGRAARQHVEDADLSWDRTARELEPIFLRAAGRSP